MRVRIIIVNQILGAKRLGVFDASARLRRLRLRLVTSRGSPYPSRSPAC